MNQSSSSTATATGTISAVGPIQAPLHIVKHADVSTQTDTPTSKFSRAFSVMGQGPRRKTVDEDVSALIDSCRRYQASAFVAFRFLYHFFFVLQRHLYI